MLDARRARLMAAIASQVAAAKAERAAQLERVENARIVAERERRAAAMGPVVCAGSQRDGPGADRASNGAARWRSAQAGKQDGGIRVCVAEDGNEEVDPLPSGEGHDQLNSFTWTNS